MPATKHESAIRSIRAWVQRTQAFRTKVDLQTDDESPPKPNKWQSHSNKGEPLRVLPLQFRSAGLPLQAAWFEWAVSIASSKATAAEW